MWLDQVLQLPGIVRLDSTGKKLKIDKEEISSLWEKRIRDIFKIFDLSEVDSSLNSYETILKCYAALECIATISGYKSKRHVVKTATLMKDLFKGLEEDFLKVNQYNKSKYTGLAKKVTLKNYQNSYQLFRSGISHSGNTTFFLGSKKDKIPKFGVIVPDLVDFSRDIVRIDEYLKTEELGKFEIIILNPELLRRAISSKISSFLEGKTDEIFTYTVETLKPFNVQVVVK